MRTLVYLSYGQGGHIRETVFSILSALDRAGPGPRGFEIVVYTDDDRPFRGLPVKFEILSEERLQDWIGPHGYKHRRKIMTAVHDRMDVLRAVFPATFRPIRPARQNPELVLEDACRVYTHRPRPRLRRRCKLAVVHRFQDAGLLQHRMRASG